MRSEEDFLGRVRVGTRTGPELWGGWGGCRAARKGRKRGTGGKEDPEDSLGQSPGVPPPGWAKIRRQETWARVQPPPLAHSSPGAHRCTTLGLLPHLESVFLYPVYIH